MRNAAPVFSAQYNTPGAPYTAPYTDCPIHSAIQQLPDTQRHTPTVPYTTRGTMYPYPMSSPHCPTCSAICPVPHMKSDTCSAPYVALQIHLHMFAGQFFGKPPENAGGGGGGGQGGFQQSGQQTHIQADVIMFSGCDDHQTSADVGNASSFGHNLPSGSGPGGAGGACTNALVAACSKKPNIMYIELLDDMRHILRQKRFTQVPQLSASKPVDLGAQFIL